MSMPAIVLNSTYVCTVSTFALIICVLNLLLGFSVIIFLGLFSPALFYAFIFVSFACLYVYFQLTA